MRLFRGAGQQTQERQTRRGRDGDALLPTPADLFRFVGLGVLAYGLSRLVVGVLHGGLAWMNELFPYLMVTVAVTKLAVDVLYFTLLGGRREWTQVDDYLLNDFFTFFRFGFPLAIVQTYLLVKGYVPLGFMAVWMSPAPALVLVLVNRWLIERAQMKRFRERGRVPLVRGREGP
jgi:hypothetical protein